MHTPPPFPHLALPVPPVLQHALLIPLVVSPAPLPSRPRKVDLPDVSKLTSLSSSSRDWTQ